MIYGIALGGLLHLLQFFVARDDSAPEGRHMIAQRVSTGKVVRGCPLEAKLISVTWADVGEHCGVGEDPSAYPPHCRKIT